VVVLAVEEKLTLVAVAVVEQVVLDHLFQVEQNYFYNQGHTLLQLEQVELHQV
jgi:hypothetical protein|tara:strand:+ start:853 stop:1011 length:159 start_codon:yes stop_codon:yes gene_type:complete